MHDNPTSRKPSPSIPARTPCSPTHLEALNPHQPSDQLPYVSQAILTLRPLQSATSNHKMPTINGAACSISTATGKLPEYWDPDDPSVHPSPANRNLENWSQYRRPACYKRHLSSIDNSLWKYGHPELRQDRFGTGH